MSAFFRNFADRKKNKKIYKHEETITFIAGGCDGGYDCMG